MSFAKFFADWNVFKAKAEQHFDKAASVPAADAGELAALREQLATLTAERDVFSAEVNTLKPQLATLTSERDAARAELATAKTQLSEAQALLADPNREANRKAADLAAAQGIDATQVPKGAGASAPVETVESLRAQIAKTSDPLERGVLAKKIQALRAKA